MGYVVYYERISRAFAPAGMVYREMSSLSRDNERSAKRRSPVRTGAMRESIDSDVRWSSAFGTTYSVSVGVDYATHVLGGTGSPIRPRGRALRIRPVPFSRFAVPTFRRSVSGQDANNFLGESMIETLVRNRLI